MSAVSRKTADEEALRDLADFFKVFGDATRIRILHALFSSPLRVQELADRIGMHQSAVSHQLRILKQAQLVSYRKAGKAVVYSLADHHVAKILDQGLVHLKEGR